ncbi:MAG: hypothetical protein IJ480_00710 [Clostridia bacterium]|nr:hypothetical protein [Clostridia bacterium]
MQLERVRSYPVPRYPTAVQFHEKESVTRYMPRRWRGKRLVGQVLIFTAMSGLCSCTLPQTEPTGQNVVTPDAENEETPWYLQMFGNGKQTGDEPERKETLSVPLFVHGEGRGSFGCDSVLPPVYLSEDEAAQVIRETALEYGVDFSGEGTVESSKLPYTNIYGDAVKKTYRGELILDGYDGDLGIGFEYVSRKDVSDWHMDTGMASSVETYDMKGTAEKLAESVADTAVFYDPGMDYSQMPEWHSEEDWDKAVEEYCALQKERMTQDLRAQVADFLEWLAGQGII